MVGAPHGLGDRLDRLEVALAGDREARLDHVDAEARQLLGDLELLADVERDPGRLLAVAQGGVEDLDVLAHGCSFWWGSSGFRQRKTSPARRHEEASASTGGCSQLRKEEALGAQFLRHEPSNAARSGRCVSTTMAREAVVARRESPGGGSRCDASSGSGSWPARRYAGVAGDLVATDAGTRSGGSPSRSRSRRSRPPTPTARRGSTPPTTARARRTIR